MFWYFVLIPVALYATLLALLWAFQSRLIYFPTRSMSASPTDIDLSFEKVEFEASDGVGLFGWFVPAERPRGVILFCHGNAGNISHRLESLQVFHRLGFSTFIFDYRGYGDSEGRPSERGTYLDAAGAWRYLVEQRNLPPAEIIIFGRSVGMSVSLGSLSWVETNKSPDSDGPGPLVLSVGTFSGVGGTSVGTVCVAIGISLATLVTDCVDAACTSVSEEEICSTDCVPLAQAVNNMTLTNFDRMLRMRLFSPTLPGHYTPALNRPVRISCSQLLTRLRTCFTAITTRLSCLFACSDHADTPMGELFSWMRMLRNK